MEASLLLSFRLENFRSFAAEATFSMLAAEDITHRGSTTLHRKGHWAILPCALTYGPNAGGKSNLISGLRLMRSLVLNSAKESQVGEAIEIEPFRLSVVEYRDPSLLELTFLIGEDCFRYGFRATPSEVTEEWLVKVVDTTDQILFERHMQNFNPSPAFTEGFGLETKTRKNALFVSVVAQFNGPVSSAVVEWFRALSVQSGLQDTSVRAYTVSRVVDDSVFLLRVARFLRALDTGIDDIAVQLGKAPNLGPDLPPEIAAAFAKRMSISQSVVLTKHSVRDEAGVIQGNVDFQLDRHESAGTQKLFALAGPIIDTLRSGGILIVDEFDARLHEQLSIALISLFNGPSNRMGAQLVITTHDSRMLEASGFLRADQVWFVEKDKRGSSSLFSLVEYKGLGDGAWAAEYHLGRFGGVPFLRSLDAAVWEE